uniref:ATPase, T2SS/T4P/T4SS family n=1 Tax=uncultured Pseudacidovorax sp. TaxID=679313 RepID=UPI0025DF5B30
MGTMERILRLMAERQASDVYLSPKAAALIRINGQCMPINGQVLPVSAPLELLREIIDEKRMAEFERTGELNTAVPLRDVGSFRVSAMRQRGSCAVVVRFIPVTVPAFDTLALPPVLKSLIMERRGLVLMVGATGSGKSTTLASMIDLRNESTPGHILTIEEPIEFAFQNK